MGLRELKAQRTRDALHETTLALAEQYGYDAVTIEKIAEQAEVAISTLYRYYPSKDAILLAPIAEHVNDLADALRRRPEQEPLDVALGRALHDYLAVSTEDAAYSRRLRAQLDVNPGPRAQLWDLWNQQRTLLEEAIADREGLDADALRVGVAAHVTMTIAQLAHDRHRDRVGHAPLIQILDEVVTTIRESPELIPRVSR